LLLDTQTRKPREWYVIVS